MKYQKGFSLLELMTVIGIVSLIGLVGFPAIDNFGRQENFETGYRSNKSRSIRRSVCLKQFIFDIYSLHFDAL